MVGRTCTLLSVVKRQAADVAAQRRTQKGPSGTVWVKYSRNVHWKRQLILQRAGVYSIVPCTKVQGNVGVLNSKRGTQALFFELVHRGGGRQDLAGLSSGPHCRGDAAGDPSLIAGPPRCHPASVSPAGRRPDEWPDADCPPAVAAAVTDERHKARRG